MNGKQKISLLLIAIVVLGGVTLVILANRPQKPVENLDFANLPPDITVIQAGYTSLRIPATK